MEDADKTPTQLSEELTTLCQQVAEFQALAAEEVAIIFEKYRQARSTSLQEGTGLGLSIVKALVEAHGGWVEVSSTPGQGTSFMVFLPGSGQSL